MFDIRKKKPLGQQISIKIDGMHCTSCGLTIDTELEETPGVFTSDTSYAKSVTTIVFDPSRVTIEQIVTKIRSLNYTVIEITQAE